MSIWEDIRGWGTREWEFFLLRALINPRTYCVLYTLGAALATLAGVTLSPDNMRGMLALFAVAALEA